MSQSPSGHVAVPQLIYRYAELLDSGDFAGVGELFTDAVIHVHETGEEYAGRDEIRAMYEDWVRTYPDNGTPHTRHVTTNLILDVDDERGTATCRSYVTVLQCTDELPLQPIVSGRYHDRFRRVDGTWRFEHRRMINDYLGDLSRHLRHPFAQQAAGERSGPA
ncbi:nuclear transport factor 2 family protein [Streptomyces sp. NPDC046909]|uniref:nuclear transport factor 2 family protein n=1 Tax=Streptomyces sp. NPDC046909 TaxID=3155617 RepID=UPI003405348B